MTSTTSASENAPRLSARQQRILTFVRAWVAHHRYAPSVREIADGVGLASPSSVVYHLDVLADHGLVRRAANSARALAVLHTAPVEPDASTHDDSAARDDRDVVTVPLLGRIAAGPPVLAESVVDDQLSLPRRLVGHGRLYALTVTGDSMTGAAIRDGDTVIVRQQPDAEDGEIVVALLGDDATVKTLRRRAGHVKLIPHNPAYDVIDGDDATVLGKVVAILRAL